MDEKKKRMDIDTGTAIVFGIVAVIVAASVLALVMQYIP